MLTVIGQLGADQDDRLTGGEQAVEACLDLLKGDDALAETITGCYLKILQAVCPQLRVVATMLRLSISGRTGVVVMKRLRVFARRFRKTIQETAV